MAQKPKIFTIKTFNEKVANLPSITTAPFMRDRIMTPRDVSVLILNPKSLEQCFLITVKGTLQIWFICISVSAEIERVSWIIWVDPV